jgi:Excalibur calcium-binding domain
VLRLVIAPVALSAAVAVGVMSPASAVRDFANCDSMHRVYQHGVAKSSAAADKQVRDGYGRPAVKPSAYRANIESDADRDGTACEA